MQGSSHQAMHDGALCLDLETKPFLVTSFANISSHSIGCVFYFVYGFLCSEKAYKFKSHLFIFAFLSLSLED